MRMEVIKTRTAIRKVPTHRVDGIHKANSNWDCDLCAILEERQVRVNVIHDRSIFARDSIDWAPLTARSRVAGWIDLCADDVAWYERHWRRGGRGWWRGNRG